jgi:hypothetical protein
MDGYLFAMKAMTLEHQRAERRQTITERCGVVADIANSSEEPFIAWCSLNDESKRLTQSINGAVEISGSMPDEEKEEAFTSFRKGQVRAIVTKPSMAAFGMNWQHCNRMSFFPSHSHEQFYQAVRRCWRFGQTKPVTNDVVATEGEVGIMKNLQRKSNQADEMFTNLVREMNQGSNLKRSSYKSNKVELPSWIK